MVTTQDNQTINRIFKDGRSYNDFRDEDIPERLIREVYDLAKMGPTSANCSPARFLFLHSKESKDRLIQHMSPGNIEKTKAAPWVAIIAYDIKFQEKLPELFPHNQDAINWFSAPKVRDVTAFRNGTLQSAYFLMAARALGLDTGPMSGFSNEGVDQEFFISSGGVRETWRSNWICNLGYGTNKDLFERSPRLVFDEACSVI